MKRLLATSLLLGYVLLVPFCFYGGIVSLGGNGMDMSHMNMGAMSEMPASNGGFDVAADHVGMYNSITHTPLASLAVLAVTMAIFFVFVLTLSHSELRALFVATQHHGRIHKSQAPRLNEATRIRRWLSLFESSPNFA